MSDDFDSVATNVSTAAERISSLTESIITKDEEAAKRAKQKIQWNNTCPQDEVDRWTTDAADLVAKLRAASPRPYASWGEHFAMDASKPGALHAIDAQYGSLDSALSELFTRVQGMQQQTHWQGRGAEAYLKQLPYQYAAVGELWSFVRTERDGLDQTALILQAILQAVEAGFDGLVTRLQAVLESPDVLDVYYQRTVDATAACESLANNLNDLSEGTEWKAAVRQLSLDYGTAELQATMFAGTDTWPSATNPASAAPPQDNPAPDSLMPSAAGVTVDVPTTSGVAADAALNVNDARYD